MNARAVLRNLALVLLVTALTTIVALVYTVNTPNRYESAGTYVIGPSKTITEPETIIRSFDSLQGQGIVPTLVELLSSSAIAGRVGTGLGLDRRSLDRYDVKASVLSSSNTLELAVTGPDPKLTAELASGIGTEASSVFEGLYSVYDIEPLDAPIPPLKPTSPDPVRNLTLAALLGFTAGVGLVVLLSRLRKDRKHRDGSSSVRTPEQQQVDPAPAGRPAARKAPVGAGAAGYSTLG